jgi:transcriptional regulator GlxA family with amidase domain
LRVAILGFDHCLASATTGLIDVFRTANALAKSEVIQWRIVSTGGRDFTTSSGLCIPGKRPAFRPSDWLVLPGLDHANVDDLLLRLRRLDHVTDQVKRVARLGGQVASCCSSAFFLANAGLLAGRSITTSWWLAGELARRHPDIDVHADKLLVEDGPILTAGAVTAYFDLALRLVELAATTELRAQCAKVMLLDVARSSQAAYAMPVVAANRRSLLITNADKWLTEHLNRSDLRLRELAQFCNISERTLLRRFREGLGTSPDQYLRQLRIERAKLLLESSELSVDEIASRCGYDDSTAFRKSFRSVTGLTTGRYRSRFSLMTA